MALNQTSQPGDNNSQEGSGDEDYADSAIDVTQHETMDGAKPRSGIMTGEFADELAR